MEKTTDIVRYPSFLRGVARIADIFGDLDEYKYSENPDAQLLAKDWRNTGNDLKKTIDQYGKKSPRKV